MRAREFIINIPINIKIDDNEKEDENLPTALAQQTSQPVETDQEPVNDETGTFVPPLQQKIELLKKSVGVKSVFDQEASDDDPLE